MYILSIKSQPIQNRFGRFNFVAGVPLEVPDALGENLVKANPKVFKKLDSKAGDKRSAKLLALLKKVTVAKEKIDSLEADKKKVEVELQEIIKEVNEETKRVEQSYAEEDKSDEEPEIKSYEDAMKPQTDGQNFLTGEVPEYTESTLKKKNKNELLAIAGTLMPEGIELTGEETNAQLVDLILGAQKEKETTETQ
jgi:hypothetical protein